MIKYIVRYIDTKAIIAVFDSRAKASWYVTDCFGPEWNTVEILSEDSDKKEQIL
mgnify:CR=1 FL=1